MKPPKIRRRLERAATDGTMLSLQRAFDTFWWHGFVVGIGPEWLLLHDVRDTRFEGWKALRIADLARVRRDRSFVPRALALRNEQPIPVPEIDLASLVALLGSAHTRFPLLTIHTEVVDDGVCFIGQAERLGRKRVTLREIDSDACWNRTRAYRYDHITRVDLGDPYAEALWLVGAQEK